MVERGRDLAAVVGYAVLATAAVWALQPGGVGGLLLAPLVVVCPGYALVRAIEGRRRVDAPELATTTLALSFATAALGGLLLNAFHVPLTARQWSTLMLVVTAAAAAVAAGRRAGADEPMRRRSMRVRPTPLLAAAGVCAILAAAAVVAIRSQRALDRRAVTTTLAVAPSHDGSEVRIAVVNADSAPGRYRVRIETGVSTTGFSLALTSGQRWSGTRHIPRSAVGPVRIQLFSATRPEAPVRTVTLG
ncbi:MAG TPA: hypothetical protein VHW04_24940 [Solirubrobacteraceae bacterium]|nr:hypothetical protein [Solirubrobacteraceae bacterium]